MAGLALVAGVGVGKHATMVTTETAPAVDVAEDVRLSPQWQVVLLDDDEHSYEYVIDMLGQLFGHSLETAFEMAQTVDRSGRVVVDTTTRERAELKQEQIHEYGPDWRILGCAGSMSAEIEPLHD